MKIQLSDHFTYAKLLRFTLPSIAMMIFSSIYGVVDGFFVSNYAGKTAFASVNLVMPFLMILSTLGFMFGAGGTALVARTLGQGDKEEANSIFSLLTYLSLGLGAVLGLVGIIFLRPVSVLLGAEGELTEDCVIYGRIILAALPFFMLQMLFQSFFAAAEKPHTGLAVTVASGLTNILLDALLVPFLPQAYKLAGAAAATAMSQVVGGLVPLWYFMRKNTSLLRLGRARWNGRAVLKACTNGSSEFMNNVSMSLAGILYNYQLLRYAGEDGVAAYGVLMYVSMIFSAAFIGYSMGSAPLVSYHYGAGNHNELKSLLKKSVHVTGVFGLGMVLAGEGLALPLSRLYVGYDAQLMALTVRGFRYFSLSFLFMGFAIYGSGFFTALNDGLTSALISFIRTLVFQIAAVLLLPLIWGVDGVWVSLIAAEFMSMILCAAFVRAKKGRYHYL